METYSNSMIYFYRNHKIFRKFSGRRLLLAWLVVHDGEAGLTAVVSVLVGGHEAAGVHGGLFPLPLDLAGVGDLVVLEGRELDLLPLVLDLLGGGVDLLLPPPSTRWTISMVDSAWMPRSSRVASSSLRSWPLERRRQSSASRASRSSPTVTSFSQSRV